MENGYISGMSMVPCNIQFCIAGDITVTQQGFSFAQ